MITVAHFAFGLAIVFLIDGKPLTGSAAAIAPDFDVILDFLYPFTHQGITHTLLAASVGSVLVYVYYEDRRSAESWMLGYCSHLLLDLLTYSGIPLFFPFMGDFALSLTSMYSLPANTAIIAFSAVAIRYQKKLKTLKGILTRSKTFRRIRIAVR